MAKTLSFVKGKGSLRHNNRDFIAKNVDPARISWNETYQKQPLEEAYALLFDQAIADYNAKQKRKDRQIDNYMNKIRNSGNKEKLFYETVVQIGKKDDTGVLDEDGHLSVDAKQVREILREYAQGFQKRNPNLYLFNAVLHMDEATPHLHLDYIPVAHTYKTGLKTRNSLTKALLEMGIDPATGQKDNETVHWQQRERAFLTDLCQEHGLEITILGIERDDYTVPEYKAAMRATEELSAELEILHAEKEEAEQMIASADVQLEASHDELAETEKHLEEINAEIQKKQSRYEVHEKKIDQVLSAEKSTEKELAQIRKNAKTVSSLLGGEPSIKLPEKDYNRLVTMAKAAGTMKGLNAAYDKEISSLQSKIDRLTGQVKKLTEKVKQHETFLNVHGLLEAFKEYVRPKTMKERLEEKQRLVNERQQNREHFRSRKNAKSENDMAI